MTTLYYIHGMNLSDAHGITCRKPDGNYAIIINADQPPEVQREALRHEVGHILYGDFDIPGGSVAEIETEAHARKADARIDAMIQKLSAVHVNAEDLKTYSTDVPEAQKRGLTPKGYINVPYSHKTSKWGHFH